MTDRERFSLSLSLSLSVSRSLARFLSSRRVHREMIASLEIAGPVDSRDVQHVEISPARSYATPPPLLPPSSPCSSGIRAIDDTPLQLISPSGHSRYRVLLFLGVNDLGVSQRRRN